jgi:hypothetical protein
MLADDQRDPHKPWRRSIAAMRAFGIVGLVIGLMYTLMFVAAAAGGPFSIWQLTPLVIVVGATAQLVLAPRLARRRRWAVSASLVLVWVEAGVVALLGVALVAAFGIIDVVRGKDLVAAVMLGIVVVILVLLGRLIADLLASYEAIALDPPPDGPRGFEPILVPRTVDPSDSAPASAVERGRPITNGQPSQVAAAVRPTKDGRAPI